MPTCTTYWHMKHTVLSSLTAVKTHAIYRDRPSVSIMWYLSYAHMTIWTTVKVSKRMLKAGYDRPASPGGTQH